MVTTNADVAAHAARVSAMTTAKSTYDSARTTWAADRDDPTKFHDMVTAWVTFSKALVDVHVADAGFSAAEATRRKDLLDIVQAKAVNFKRLLTSFQAMSGLNPALDTSTASTDMLNAKAEIVTALTNYVGEWATGADD